VEIYAWITDAIVVITRSTPPLTERAQIGSALQDDRNAMTARKSAQLVVFMR